VSDKPKVEFKSDDKDKLKRMFSDYATLTDKGREKEAKHLLHNIHSDIRNMKPR
jgi:hypothetical protein